MREDELEDEIKDLKQEIEDLNTEMAALESDLEDANDKVYDLEIELNNALNDIDEMEGESTLDTSLIYDQMKFEVLEKIWHEVTLEQLESLKS